MSLANSVRTDRKRSYRSSLRQAQAAATHDRILEGLVRTMAEGVSELSIPAVAREADVSVATVYRHFPTKEALLQELPDYFARQSGMDRQWVVPATWAEYEGMVHRLYGAYGRFDDIARAAIVSQVAREAKRAQLEARIEFARASLASVAPELGAAALERVARLSLVLVTSSTFQWYSSLGLSPDEAAEHALWAIKSAIRTERGET